MFVFLSIISEHAANGRAAMLGFTSVALSELSSHTPALEQMANGFPAIVLVSLTLTFATIVPKIVSGSSLKELHEVRITCHLSTSDEFMISIGEIC